MASSIPIAEPPWWRIAAPPPGTHPPGRRTIANPQSYNVVGMVSLRRSREACAAAVDRHTLRVAVDRQALET